DQHDLAVALAPADGGQRPRRALQRERPPDDRRQLTGLRELQELDHPAPHPRRVALPVESPVDADHADVLQEHPIAGNVGDTAARESDHEQPSLERETASRALEDIAADRIEDDVGALAVSLAGHAL